MSALGVLQAAADAAGAAQPVLPQAYHVEGRRLHVDGDMLAYMAGGGKDTSVEVSRRMFWGKLGTLSKVAGTEDIILHLTVSGSLKGNRPLYSVTTPYQNHRVNKTRPKNWGYIRDYMELGNPGFRVMQWSDREADDGLLLAASFPSNVISSGDKDMRTGTGLHITWDDPELIEVTDEYGFEHRGLLYGDKWLLTQLIMGDDADHIPGLGRGVGPATAAKILAGTTCKGEGLEAVAAAYQKKYGEQWAYIMAEQLFLLYIRRTTKAPDDEWLSWIPKGTPLYKHLSQACFEHMARVSNLLEEAKAICQLQS